MILSLGLPPAPGGRSRIEKKVFLPMDFFKQMTHYPKFNNLNPTVLRPKGNIRNEEKVVKCLDYSSNQLVKEYTYDPKFVG